MLELIKKLEVEFPKLKFVAAEDFSWSPETSEILYIKTAKGHQAVWSLLHETGHALLKHTAYKADFELIKLEMAAWDRAQQLAAKFEVKIDEDHIQDCLDTYRDWLYKRSICPTCSNKSLQQDDYKHYRCFNCHTVWRVSANRFCRAYRYEKTSATAEVFPA